jgi:Phage portal protein
VTDQQQPTLLCISTYEKGQPFIQEVARLGVSVILLTVDKLEHADWPRDSISKLVTMPENLTPEQVLNTVSYLARENRIDRIVPLDEFDLEVAALLREHMRLPGMGETLTRHFRDKLAMRVRARQCGVPVPEFTSVFNYPDIRSFLRHVPGPWLLNVEQMNLAFITDTLRPILSCIEAEVVKKLIKESGKLSELTCQFDLSERQRGDSTAIAATVACGRQWGALTANEARLMLGKPALDEPAADLLMTPINMQNIQRLLDPPKAAATEQVVQDAQA